MSKYKEAYALNQKALVDNANQLNQAWDKECLNAAKLGKFPDSVCLSVPGKLPQERLASWSDKDYEAYQLCYENDNGFDDWCVRLRPVIQPSRASFWSFWDKK